METDKLSENGTQHDGDIGNSPSRAGTTHDESEVDEKATVKMAKLQKFTSLEDQQTRMPFRRLLQVYGCLGQLEEFMKSLLRANPPGYQEWHSSSVSWIKRACRPPHLSSVPTCTAQHPSHGWERRTTSPSRFQPSFGFRAFKRGKSR